MAARRRALSTGVAGARRGLHALWRYSSLLGLAPAMAALTVLGRAAQNVGQTTYPIEGHQLLGIGNGAIGVMTALGGLLGAVVAATFGARVTPSNALAALAAGQAMVLCAFLAFALPFGGVPGLWLGAVLVWTGSGLVFPAAMTAVGTGEGDAARSMAVYALGLSLGLMGGPLLESWVLRLLSDSPRLAFAVLVPMPAIATALACLGALVERHRRSGPAVAPGGVSAAGGSPAEPAAGRGARTRNRPTSLLRLPAYRLALATLFMYQAPYSAVVAFGGLLATRDDGATTAAAALGFAAFYAVSFLVRAAMVRLSPLRHLRSSLVASTVVTLGGIAVLGTAHSFWVLVVGMALLGAPHGLTFPMAGALLAVHVEHEDLGRANARLLAATNGGAVSVPLMCGWLAAALGYRTMFLFVEVPVVLFGLALVAELSKVRSWAVPSRREPVPAGLGEMPLD